MDAMRGLGEMKVLIQLPLTSHHFTRGLRVSGTWNTGGCEGISCGRYAEGVQETVLPFTRVEPQFFCRSTFRLVHISATQLCVTLFLLTLKKPIISMRKIKDACLFRLCLINNFHLTSIASVIKKTRTWIINYSFVKILKRPKLRERPKNTKWGT